MTPQALPAPVLAACARFHSAAAGCAGESGRGSNDHSSAPVRASKARMTPRSTSVARLSPIAEPTITMLP